MNLKELLKNERFKPFENVIDKLNDEIEKPIYCDESKENFIIALNNGLLLKLTTEKNPVRCEYKFEIIDEITVIEKLNFTFWNFTDYQDFDTTVMHSYLEFENSMVLKSDYTYKFKGDNYIEDHSTSIKFGVMYQQFEQSKNKSDYEINKMFTNGLKINTNESLQEPKLDFVNLNKSGYQKTKK